MKKLILVFCLFSTLVQAQQKDTLTLFEFIKTDSSEVCANAISMIVNSTNPEQFAVNLKLVIDSKAFDPKYWNNKVVVTTFNPKVKTLERLSSNFKTYPFRQHINFLALKLRQ